MAVIGTFNSWNIIGIPTKPGFRSVDFTISDSVGEARSPFTGQSQFQQWPGADFWQVHVSLPPMNRASAATWIAFLMELRGKANCFYLGDPYAKTPQGAPKGLVVVDGVTGGGNLIGATTIRTKGWAPAVHRLLLPGDYLSIGPRLHMALSQVDSDALGLATITIWPSLRDTTTDGEAISFNYPKGLFRLSSNVRKWSVSEARTFGISFDCTEAR